MAGRFLDVRSDESRDGIDLCHGGRCDGKDMQAAFGAAASAAGKWAAMAHSHRAKVLFDAAGIIERRQEEFAAALVGEVGSWIGKAMF